MEIPEVLNKEPFPSTWELFKQFRIEQKAPLTELAEKIILNRFVRTWKYNADQATESLEQSMLATRLSDGKPWLGVYQIHQGKGRVDGKIYLLTGMGEKKEIDDRKLDELKLKHKENLRYDEKERCYWVRR